MAQKTTTKTHLIPGAIITPHMAAIGSHQKTSHYQQALDKQVAALMAADSRIAR